VLANNPATPIPAQVFNAIRLDSSVMIFSLLMGWFLRLPTTLSCRFTNFFIQNKKPRNAKLLCSIIIARIAVMFFAAVRLPNVMAS
jgi:hypothetical protein